MAGVLAVLVRSKPGYVRPPETAVLDHLKKIQDAGMDWVLLATFREVLQKTDKLRLKIVAHPCYQKEKAPSLFALSLPLL